MSKYIFSNSIDRDEKKSVAAIGTFEVMVQGVLHAIEDFFLTEEGAWKDPEHAALILGGYKVFL
jgi:hypothetical protein